MRLFLIMLLLFFCLPATAQTGWQQGWGLSRSPEGKSSRPDTPQLRLVPHNNTVQVWVDITAAGPWEVRLRPAGTAMPGLPLQRVINGPASVQLFILPTGPASQLLLDAVPGAPGIMAGNTAYALPFEATTPVRIHQSAQGQASHQDAQNRHAWDFALPEGTPVLAARSGRVMETMDGSQGPSRRPGDGGNWIRVLHEDGSMAVYAHLQAGSLAVRTGQRLRQGQLLARSGNSGFSTGPHLHFVVQRNAGLSLQSIPVELNGPQGRLQASTHSSTAP